MTYRIVSVFFCCGHARTSSDSEYVAESPAPARAGGTQSGRANCARTFPRWWQ
ncbi:hypothetical protein L838_2264 [Mycobacterium avium MAV_120709_2344]|nr:hypothetical protein L838_2264 [Mycobacterium avium MAV_120709_2344]ETZ66515.1 hypothetical protein L841_3438 [Mycobacterium sp. MAC_080597_8934]